MQSRLGTVRFSRLDFRRQLSSFSELAKNCRSRLGAWGQGWDNPQGEIRGFVGVHAVRQLIRVTSEPEGNFTAQAVGMPDLRATAGTKEQAIEQVQFQLARLLDTGQLLSVEVPEQNPLMKWSGHARNDPDFELYKEEIQRYRQEMDAKECSDSSSIPIT